MSLRKVIVVMMLLLFVVSLSGCFTIKVSGNGQQLASSSQTGNLIGEKRIWYAVWGLVPITDNSTDELMPASGKKVRVETTFTFIDLLISAFTGMVSIECNTAMVYEVP
jgi:hypothetical protein